MLSFCGVVIDSVCIHRVACMNWGNSSPTIFVVGSFPSRPLQWRHNGHDSVSNHQPHDCLLSRLFRRRSKKTSKLRAIGLCAGNSPVTGEFPAQMVSNAENVSIWWRHHAANTSGIIKPHNAGWMSVSSGLGTSLPLYCNDAIENYNPSLNQHESIELVYNNGAKHMTYPHPLMCMNV